MQLDLKNLFIISKKKNKEAGQMRDTIALAKLFLLKINAVDDIVLKFKNKHFFQVTANFQVA